MYGSHTRCLRFAAALLTDSRKTRFRLLARLCRAGFFRLPGSIERFPFSLPPFPGFAWRDVIVDVHLNVTPNVDVIGSPVHSVGS